MGGFLTWGGELHPNGCAWYEGQGRIAGFPGPPSRRDLPWCTACQQPCWVRAWPVRPVWQRNGMHPPPRRPLRGPEAHLRRAACPPGSHHRPFRACGWFARINAHLRGSPDVREPSADGPEHGATPEMKVSLGGGVQQCLKVTDPSDTPESVARGGGVGDRAAAGL